MGMLQGYEGSWIGKRAAEADDKLLYCVCKPVTHRWSGTVHEMDASPGLALLHHWQSLVKHESWWEWHSPLATPRSLLEGQAAVLHPLLTQPPAWSARESPSL